MQSDIVRVRNEAVISNVTLAEARNLSKANGIRRENIRENMDVSITYIHPSTFSQ